MNSETLKKLHEQRQAIKHFVAPFGKGTSKISIFSDGLLQEFKFTNKDKKSGWGYFQRWGNKARLLREADEIEVLEYLQNSHTVKLIIADKAEDDAYFAFPYNLESFSKKYVLNLPVIVNICGTNVRPFDVVEAAALGSFIFKEVDYTRSEEFQRYLTQCLSGYVDPGKLSFPGLSPEYKLAYSLAYEKSEDSNPRVRDEKALKRELGKLGGSLVSFRDYGGYWTVTWQAPSGAQQTSKVYKNFNLDVAGFCISGDDHKFDLASIVGVYERLKNNRYW